MAKTPTTKPDPVVTEPVVTAEEPTTLPAPVAASWFAPDPFAATLAANPKWPAVDPLEPSAAVDLSTAPTQPITPAQKA